MMFIIVIGTIFHILGTAFHKSAMKGMFIKIKCKIMDNLLVYNNM